ncbi:MAG: M3 family metallopeptidase [Bdellovibrionota bacterium]
MYVSRFTAGVILASAVSVIVGCGAGNGSNHDGARTLAEQRMRAGGPIRSDYKVGEVTKLCDEAIARVNTRLTAVGKIPSDKRSVESTMLEFEDALADFSDESNGLTFMGYVSKDDKVRAEGTACEEKLGQLFVELFTRRDLFEALKPVKGRNAEETRLVAETVKAFERNGLNLSDEKLAELKKLMGELSKKETKFTANLNNDKSSLEFSEAQLAGLPADSMKRLSKAENGNYIVTTKSTDYVEVMENVTNADTRKAMMLAYLNRGTAENTQLLEEATGLRAQIAQILGYETWSDYKTADRMAKSRTAVNQFMTGLKGKLAKRNRADLAKLLKFKKELDPKATKLDQWDVAFMSYQLKKRDYTLDNEKIREFFPADVVVAGMFEVYSKLLGVSFHEVKNADVWSDDVKLYEIHDAKEGRRIGHFYADFFPREGKYGHAAAFTLVSGRKLESGYQETVSSIVSNFTPAGNGKPSLLTHDEVETIFHEFGHIMHQTLTRAPFGSLSGSSTARDFVEAPSQMLENWVWSPQILPLISGHYQDQTKKLPADLLKKMLEAKDFGQGMFYTKQLLYGSFDMAIHSGKGRVDVTKTYDDLYREIVGEEPIAGGHFGQTFGHMMGGYDAGYYGYLWSEVYAQDMFSLFEKQGLLNSELGGRYRSAILENGNMRDALELLKEFLGRE